VTLTRKQILIGTTAFVCIVIVAVVGCFALFVYLFTREDRSPEAYHSARECILEWGRLSPFPPSAQQLSINTEGGFFTRSFRVSFTAPPADIERWLQASPGTRETSPTTPSVGIRHFQIAPGGGANRAEVSVDDSTNLVLIYVSWS
jgi:hypothetical protein